MSAYLVDMNIMRDIYAHMGDEYLKDMFGNRLLYSLTGDNKYIKNVIKMTKEGTEFYHKLEDENRKKVIFGAGTWGQEKVRSYPDIKFECFADNNAGKMIDEMSIRQYFDLPELKAQMNPEGEVFVDGGSFDGRISTLIYGLV